MMQTIQAKTVTLRDLIDRFGLQLVRDAEFFPEWQVHLPDVDPLNQEFLNRVIDGFVNLLDYPPLLEDVVRMSVLDPLLFLGGFYLPPFHVRSEPSVELVDEDQGVLITGSLDTLILKDRLWVLVVESKRVSFSVEAGLPQILSYMLAQPDPNRPSYGMITNGSSFLFLKLIKTTVPHYATSRLFGIRNPGDLHAVFQILKHLGDLA
jgi:hypothetical protein